MGAIYIGGQRNTKKSGSNAKIYFFLFIFMVIIGSALKVSAPMIVENWINQNGVGATGYAFSIRDVDISIVKGQMVLKDAKVFNPKTTSRLLEVPNLTIILDWPELFMSQEKKFSVFADKVDLVLSKDFSSEMARVQAISESQKQDLYLDAVEAKLDQLNIIEQKDDQSRTVLALNDVSVKVKELSLLSINKNTEFSVSSKIADGGKLQLTGKTSAENGSTPWSIQGSIKQVPADFFNKIAGNELPFSFNESHLNAEISARSDNGKVIGEISPDIKRLNLLQEKPGVPTQTIARALTEDLTFTLPFTLKDELTVLYTDTFRKLKDYRKYPASSEGSRTLEAEVSQGPKSGKPFSFWPF